MLDIRDFKVKRYVFLLISALCFFYCDPLPTNPNTEPPSELKFEGDNFNAYVGDSLNLNLSFLNVVDEFKILPQLPPGLSINSKTGVISGIASSASDSTKYTVIATNKNGAATTEISIVIVSYPYFILEPQSQSTTEGGTALFTASAKGNAPLSYKWTKDNVLLLDTGKTLKIINLKTTSTGTYRCVVTDGKGKVVVSNPAYCQITISGIVPKITLTPSSRSALIGESLILSGNATGSDLEYKWLFNGTLVPAIATPYLLIESMKASDSGKYVLIVSNKFGADTSSPPAHLTIAKKTDTYFNLDIVISGKGSVIINNQTFARDTIIKFLSGTTFTVNTTADSANTLSSVLVDDSINTSAVPSRQIVFSNFNQNHSVNITFTKILEPAKFTLTCLISPEDHGTVLKPDTALSAGDTIQTPIPNVTGGYEFKVWRQTGGSGVLFIADSTSLSTKVAISKGPVILTAVFVPKQTSITVSIDGTTSHGAILIEPVKTTYTIGDTVKITARPDIGYVFSSWTGDLSGATISQNVVILKSLSINATFTFSTTIQEDPILAGNSINAEIKKVSALNIPGAILTPSNGKYDNNTIEIIGKVTIPIQRR